MADEVSYSEFGVATVTVSNLRDEPTFVAIGNDNPPFNFKKDISFIYKGESFTCEQLLDLPDDTFREIYNNTMSGIPFNDKEMVKNMFFGLVAPAYHCELLTMELIQTKRDNLSNEKRISSLEDIIKNLENRISYLERITES